MKERVLGRSGPTVSAIGLECMSVGIADVYTSSVREDAAAVELLHRALDLGHDGPFTLVARFTPQKGLSSIGRDASNDVVLPVEAAPPRVGEIEWPGGDRATFRAAPGITALVDGKPVSEITISKPATIRIGDMTLRVRIRDAALRISVRPGARLKIAAAVQSKPQNHLRAR